MSLQPSNNSSISKGYSIVTPLCHVERPRAETRCLVSLDCSTLNGVETSLNDYRCCNSACCNLTPLLVNLNYSAWVAQHDK
jgi:hypothetical protein